MNKKISLILVLGVLLRIFLSLTTYHPDIVPFDFAGRVLTETKASNFYDYLWQLPDDHPYLSVYPRNLFNYPPLTYFFLGGFSRITTILINPVFHNNFLLNFQSTLGKLQLNFLLLFLKLPYFFFDIAIAYLLMSFFADDKKKTWAFTLWIFNPINLYATYMMGQFDIIPTFLAVMALYLINRNKSKLSVKNLITSAVLLGLGASFKIFPILFLFPLAFLVEGFWKRSQLVVIGILTYIVTAMLPFINSSGFRSTALLAGQTTKSLYAQIPISGGESIILFLVAVVFSYLVFYYKKANTQNLWKRFFIMLVIFFIFTHYHPQWFLWITPFLVLDLVETKFRHWLLVVISLFSFLALVTFFDPGLTVWLFSPVFPSLYGLPGIWDQFGLNIDINLSRSLFQSIFVGVAAYYLYYYFPKSNEEK